LQQPPARILDLCTGSGCIGIEAAHQFPDAQVDLVDISEPALSMALLNAKAHGVSDRVQCIQSDGFSALSGNRYDLILLNPPYVGAEEMAQMPAEFHHEPRLALASGEDGLVLTRQLLRAVEQHLTPEGMLFLEVGYSADALAALYPEFPFVWLEFAHGGQGVTVLSAEDCLFFAI
jgi:ribosomal protein L3 glutamine methyltransferase